MRMALPLCTVLDMILPKLQPDSRHMICMFASLSVSLEWKLPGALDDRVVIVHFPLTWNINPSEYDVMR